MVAERYPMVAKQSKAPHEPTEKKALLSFFGRSRHPETKAVAAVAALG
jgi:hypothetical protein